MMIHVVVPRIEDFPMIFIADASIDQDCKMWFWDHWSAREKIHYDMGTRYADTIYNDVSGFAGYSMNREGAESLRHKYMQELRQEFISARDEAQAQIDRIEGVIDELNAIDP